MPAPNQYLGCVRRTSLGGQSRRARAHQVGAAMCTSRFGAGPASDTLASLLRHPHNTNCTSLSRTPLVAVSLCRLSVRASELLLLVLQRLRAVAVRHARFLSRRALERIASLRTRVRECGENMSARARARLYVWEAREGSGIEKGIVALAFAQVSLAALPPRTDDDAGRAELPKQALLAARARRVLQCARHGHVPLACAFKRGATAASFLLAA
eukprot:3102151-Pleurochrysis_carterae.AAC.1